MKTSPKVELPFNLVKVPRDLTKRPPTPPQNGG